jgi:hypothetical protein
MTDDRRLQEGWAPKHEEKGMGPGKPLLGTVPPPKPNDAASSARPQHKPSE